MARTPTFTLIARAGQASIEYVLLLVAFGLPTILLFRLLLRVMAQVYGALTFLETLPLP